MGALLKPGCKPKLPQFLSFPVGVQALSISLTGIPQFDALELVFSASPNLRATTFRRQVMRGVRARRHMPAAHVRGVDTARFAVSGGRLFMTRVQLTLKSVRARPVV